MVGFRFAAREEDFLCSTVSRPDQGRSGLLFKGYWGVGVALFPRVKWFGHLADYSTPIHVICQMNLFLTVLGDEHKI
jgi:hypothetical protein